MLLIKNGYMIDPKSGCEGKYDILIENGRIIKIGERMEQPIDCQVIDAEGLVVAPGLVDVHVHFRDPGFTAKEDILTGAAAAKRGGFTTVIMMANTNPHIDNEDTLVQVIEKGKTTGINVLACGNVTVGMKGEKLTDMDLLAGKGAVGFTDDGVPLMDETLVREALEKCAKLDMPISFHEENPEYIGNNGINKGRASEYFGIEGASREAEITMVERDLKLALEADATINIQHISAKESVELVRQAKKKGRGIHAEATPHHFTLTEDAAIEYGTLAKMNPPLREEEDRQAIIKGLVDGTIDIIATDHAPHTEEEKNQPLTKAPSGIIGLETSLSLGITKLVGGGYMTLKTLLERMSTNPAALYHLDAGYIAEGAPADLVLIDTADRFIAGDYASKASNSPFTGWELCGRAVKTICAGNVVYEFSDSSKNGE